MSDIREIKIDNKEEWNAVVRSVPEYDVFYLAEYSMAFAKENPKNGEPLLLVYENDNNIAINVVMCRDISEDNKLKGKVEPRKYYDLITPYGYGGFCGKIDDWDELARAYSEYCKENGYICEFVRFNLFTEYYQHYAGEVESRTRNVVRSLDISLEEIWGDFKQKVRKNVKRAERENLEILIECSGEHLEDFLKIYYSTMDRTNAENDYYFSKMFYETLNGMPDNVAYFYALHEGKIVSCELVLYDETNCYSYLGGTYREYFDLRPNDFLKYEIIKWAKEKGLKNFVLGGGYGEDDGIFQYKACLAPNGIRNFYIGRKIFDKQTYDELVKLRGNDVLNEKFFPLYRS